MNLRLHSFREGDRGEYLTQYVLSALGISVPVPRQEDIGIDFHCTLAKPMQDNKIIFDSPYLVQAKNINELKEGILFGDFTKSKQHKSYEVDWLFSQEMPLFITGADMDEHRIHIYNTIGIWVAYLQSDSCAQILLKPTLPGESNPRIEGHGPIEVTELENIRDGKRWIIPLGLPIASIHINDLTDKNKVEVFKQILKCSIEIDKKNIMYRNLGIPHTIWFTKIITNDISKYQHGGMYASKRGLYKGNDKLLEAFIPLFISMAYNYKINDMKKEFNSLKEIATLIDKDKIPSWMMVNINELFP